MAVRNRQQQQHTKTWVLLLAVVLLVGNQLIASRSLTTSVMSWFSSSTSMLSSTDYSISSTSSAYTPLLQPQSRQRKVFHNLLTLPETFVVRRDTNRGQVTTFHETTIHEIPADKQGCMRTLSITMTKNHNRPGICTPLDVFDLVTLRIYVDNDDDAAKEPAVETVVNPLFGIHNSDALKGATGASSQRKTVNNYLYSITANGAMVLKIPAPFAEGFQITLQQKQHFNQTTPFAINFWSFLDYEEYPLRDLQEPLRLQIRQGELDKKGNQLRMAQAYHQRGYIIGFTLGVQISEEGKQKHVDYQDIKGKKVDLWFHNGGELLVLDQRLADRASLIHGVGAEDAFFESCSPAGNNDMMSDTHGFQYVLDEKQQPLRTAMVHRVDHVSAYRVYLEHDVIPFEQSFAFHMGNTEHYEYSSVVYWYGTLPTQEKERNTGGVLIDQWEVCTRESFSALEEQTTKQQALKNPPQRSKYTACKQISTYKDEFLDLTYVMIAPGSITNQKLTANVQVPVFAKIPYERLQAILLEGQQRDACIQLEIFHDDFTMIWWNNTQNLIYVGETRRGHRLALSDPIPLPPSSGGGGDVELTILMANTENNNFRAWLLGITARSAKCK